jgi:chromosomal replication initiator protein
MYTFTRWVLTPENRSARLAVEQVADCLGSDRQRRQVNPLFLHGPSGTGKTHLLSALAGEVARRCPYRSSTLLPAGDLQVVLPSAGDDSSEGPSGDIPAAFGDSDLLLVEDLQHLPARLAESFVRWFDDRLARQQQMVFTARMGPAQLAHLPARLTSRLACGLVVGLQPLSPASRLAFLQDRAQRRQLAVSRDVLAWLAEHLTGSGRHLEGAVARLEALVRLHNRLPDVALVADHFRAEADATQPTLSRIVERVGTYFQVEPRQLQSRRRSHNALLPRQVSMYLARRLTPLSLEQIGAYFGGRDHSTVLHACHKVEQALARDANLSGAVRQLHADLA